MDRVRQAVLPGVLGLLSLGASCMAQAPTPHAQLGLVLFDHSAFPYSGDSPEQDRPFLDVTVSGRRGHTSPRGGVLFEDPTYSDRRSLLFIPRGFDPARPAALILFFHGNLATLDRDVVERQAVPHQVEASRINAVLVAPQMASDALDSSAGHFWQQGFLDAYLDEAAGRLSALSAGSLPEAALADLPVIVVAYSGGYLPAAFSLARSRTRRRIMGVILFDALFGETEKFQAWIARDNPDAFFLSAYSKASMAENVALQTSLAAQGRSVQSRLGPRLEPGTITFVSAASAVHNDFVTRAWTSDPLAAVLRAVVLSRR